MNNNSFTIDFFELSFLAEACIPPVPIARNQFFRNLIDKYYYQLDEHQIDKMFEWITRERKFDTKNELCSHFYARYNKYNSYLVTTLKEKDVDCYLYDGEYHTAVNTFIMKSFITDIKQKYARPIEEL